MAVKEEIIGIQQLTEFLDKIKKLKTQGKWELNASKLISNKILKQQEISSCKNNLEKLKLLQKECEKKKQELEDKQKQYITNGTLTIDKELCKNFKGNTIENYDLRNFFGSKALKKVKEVVYKGGKMTTCALAGCETGVTLKVEPTSINGLKGLNKGSLCGNPIGADTQPVTGVDIKRTWLDNKDLGKAIVLLNQAGVNILNLNFRIFVAGTEVDAEEVMQRAQDLRNPK